MRRTGSTRVLFRTLLPLAVLVALGLVAVGSAGAATITSWQGGKGATPAIVTAGGEWCPPTLTTINGTGFVSEGIRSITIGGVPASEIIVGSNIIVYARVGAGATDGPLVLTNNAGSSVTASLAVNVVPCQSTAAAQGKPTITTIPAKAKAGKKFRILGSGYIGTRTVTVGGIATKNYAIQGDDFMYIRMPEDAKDGVVTVEVTNNQGSVKAQIVKIAA